MASFLPGTGTKSQLSRLAFLLWLREGSDPTGSFGLLAFESSSPRSKVRVRQNFTAVGLLKQSISSERQTLCNQ
jgi:hypothetical protein